VGTGYEPAQVPETPSGQSPTVWRDESNGDLVVQGYRATEGDYVQAELAGSTPGHHHGADTIPGHETIVRLPASMLPALLAALA
jgi:hypothetical protein